jgi:hypothetical protein
VDALGLASHIALMARGTGDELQKIPGVGTSISRDLRDLGIARVADLEGADPEMLFDRLCELRGTRMDPCVRYVFRCAVYFAEHARPDPELLKWWNWKDRPYRRSEA